MIPKACYVSQKWGDLVKLKAREEKIDFSNWKYFLQEYFTETLPQILGNLEDLYKGNQVFWGEILKKSFNYERQLGKALIS